MSREAALSLAVPTAKIQVCDVSHVFSSADKEFLAVDRATLEIPTGQFVSILGPSGCGKTTLMRMMYGLIKPSAGTVLIDGKPVTGPRPESAMVFQDHNLLPWRNVLENVEFGLELAGMPAARRRDRAMHAITEVGLENFTRSYPFQLSGGMRQRVGLARALCMEPQVLFMDEPFGALDAQTRELMQFQLLKIWEQHRITVVFVTHDIGEAIYLSDRVVVMSARPGRIKTVQEIDLPRPRWVSDQDIRTSEQTMAYRRQIWELLRPEIADAQLSKP